MADRGAAGWCARGNQVRADRSWQQAAAPAGVVGEAVVPLPLGDKEITCCRLLTLGCRLAASSETRVGCAGVDGGACPTGETSKWVGLYARVLCVKPQRNLQRRCTSKHNEGTCLPRVVQGTLVKTAKFGWRTAWQTLMTELAPQVGWKWVGLGRAGWSEGLPSLVSASLATPTSPGLSRHTVLRPALHAVLGYKPQPCRQQTATSAEYLARLPHLPLAPSG